MTDDIRASLARENDFYRDLFFPPEWHERSRKLREQREVREREEAEQLRDQHPDRFSDWESPAHIKRALERERDEDRMQR